MRDKGTEGQSEGKESGHLTPRSLDPLTPVVSARGLTRVYRRGAERIHALKGIDLEVREGEFLGVMGHSGAGKTTLLNLIGLMDRPTEGSLVVLGRDVSRNGRGLDALRRANIGFVFQDFYLMASLSAMENVLLPTMWGRGNGERRSANDERQTSAERARELLKMVGLGRRMSHRPAELSGGEMQRVAVARALVNSPRLLLADEPTGNLDTRTRDDILCLLQSLNRDSGLTVVVATHDLGLESRLSRQTAHCAVGQHAHRIRPSNSFTRVVHLEDGAVR